MTDFINEQEPFAQARARRFDPARSRNGDPTTGFSALTDDCMGDWSWKPFRNKQFPQFEMPAYKGAMRGPAELYRREAFPRS